jgi:hypothetical protein
VEAPRGRACIGTRGRVGIDRRAIRAISAAPIELRSGPIGAWREFGRRFRRVALLASAALFLTAPTAFAGNGEVSGKVTSASSHAGIEHVEVLYYKVGSEDHEFYKLETTNSSGDYSGVLAAGYYTVEFVPPSGSVYAVQYYKDKLSSAAADRVVVEENKKTVASAELSRSNSIAGTVTSAASDGELDGIEVTAYEAKAPNAAVKTADTDAFGKYELQGLPRGEYVLGFRPALGSGLNYAPQYYRESARFGEATTISLGEEEHKQFSASLLKGGSISGTVTDAATHQPLAGIIVDALAAGNALPISAAVTDANGNYTLAGMGSGSVVLAFVLSTKEDQLLYLPQLYSGRPFPEEFKGAGELLPYGTPVQVTAGIATTGIDAAMVRREPADAAPPIVTGTPAVGQTLQCAIGSWTGIPKLLYTQQWLRDGTAIAGASAATYVVQAGDVGHGLACEVTATNELGSASAVSNTVAVPTVAGFAPPPTKAVPAILLSATRISVSGHSASAPLKCTGAPCAGSIELTERVKVIERHRRKRTTSKQETLVLAKGTYSLASGAGASIAVRLTAAGRSALANVPDHRLVAEEVVSVGGGKTVQRSVSLGSPVVRKRAAKRV